MLLEAGSVAATDTSTLVGIVRSTLAGDGVERWCNLQFEVDEDDPGAAPDSALFSLLAARGPTSPLATVIGAVSGKKASSPQLGIQHRAGQKAIRQLARDGIDLPDDWTWIQDHPRRGLIADLPPSGSADDVVEFLVPAMHLLNRAPITGTLLYEVFAADR